jgi:hypothetical protein
MLAALLLALLAGSAEHPSYLTGTWFGQGEPNDRSEMWLAHADANGDFTAQFRSCRKGKARDYLEKGTWSFQGDTEIVQITQAGGMIVFQETPYKILFHDGNHQTYSMPSGFVFKSARVDAGFRMPPCDLTS